MSQIDDDSANKHPTSISNHYLSPQVTDLYSAHSEEKIILQQIVSGEFFITQERENLLTATYALHAILPAIRLIEALIPQFVNFSLNQQFEALNFLKNYFLLDTSHHCIPIHKKGSQLIKILTKFYQNVENISDNNPIIKEKISDIQTLITQKIRNKKHNFRLELDRIAHGHYPLVDLLRRLNSILLKLEHNKYDRAKLEEYYFILSKIAHAPSLGTSDAAFEQQLQIALTTVTDKIARLLPDIEGLKKLRHYIKNNMHTSLSAEHEEQYIDHSSLKLNKLFDSIALNTLSTIQYEQALEMLVNNIEYGFIKLLSAIDLDELRELTWLKNENRMKNNLTLPAPNVHLYYQYLNFCTHYLSIMLLHSENEAHELKYREDIRQIKNIFAFMQQALIKALNKNAAGTAHSIYYAMKNPALARLPFLAKIEDYSTQLKVLSHSSKGAPFLSSLQHLLIKVYSKRTGTPFEKRVLIGKILKNFEEKKHGAIAKILTHDDLFPQFINFFKRHYLLYTSQLASDSIVNETAASELMQRAAYDLLPNNFEEHELRDFIDLSELIAHLQYCYNRQTNFHLTKKFPERDIAEFTLELSQTDDDLTSFNQVMQVLELIDKIDTDLGRMYKAYNSDLLEILNCYQQKLIAHLKYASSEAIPVLEKFFDEYYKNSKIKAILNSNQDSLNPFSVDHKLHAKVHIIDNLYETFRKQLSQLETLRSQQAYSQLLLDVLEEREPSGLLQLTSHNADTLIEQPSLLPDSEFDVPSAEPEHPDKIGINRTMSFNPRTEKPSVLEAFKTDELISEFLHSFPWAISLDDIEKLAYAHCDPELNLLGTPDILEAKLQLGVVKYILISIDALTKAAGTEGEMVLGNFNLVKTITDNLHQIAELITIPHIVHTPEFETKLADYTQAIVKLNGEYLDYNSVEMNAFCHINEQLAHILMGIDYSGSSLIPNIPDSFYLEKINEALHPAKKKGNKGKQHTNPSSEAHY